MVSVSDIVTVALVGGIGVGGYYLYKHRNDIGNAINEIGGTITDTANDIGNGFQDYQDSGLYQSGTTILEMTGKISDGSNPVKTFVEGSQISNPFEMAINFLGNAGKQIADALGGESELSKLIEKIQNKELTPVEETSTTTPIVETPTPIVEDTTTIEDVTPSQKYKGYAITRKLFEFSKN